MAKKTAKKAASKKAALKKTSNGVTANQIKVLKALKSGKEMNRTQLIKVTGIAGGWSKMFGAATREDGGVQGTGLIRMGLVTVSQYEGSRELTNQITSKGKKLLQTL